MRWLAVFIMGLFAVPAFGLGLGEIEGRAIIGRPLHITIPILGLQEKSGETACVSLVTHGDDDRLAGIYLKVADDRVHILTARSLNQPILQFRVRLGCASVLERGFLVLPEPPGSDEKTILALPEQVSARTGPVAPGDSANPARPQQSASVPASVPSAGRSIVLMSATSLRMLSRQRYPGDSATRVDFIRQMAAANPHHFATEAAAYDQRLAAGTRLLMPATVPPPHRGGATATDSGAAPRTPGTLPRPAPPAAHRAEPGAAGGRLIVGAGGLSGGKGPSVAELNETLDRLIEVMNQQVMVEIALTERIKGAEAELAELKRQVQAERIRSGQLEAEIKAVREAAERTGAIQLGLLVLLGGLAGAWVLTRMARRKAKVTEGRPLPFATISPAKPAMPDRVQQMPSVFDDLLDLEDILPPGKPR